MADASQTCLSPAALGLWFQQCRASPCSLCQPSTEYLTGSAPDLLQLSQFPKFKKEIQNIPSPPSTKSSVLLKGEGPGWTESCSDLTQLFRVKKEKSRNGQLAILNKRSKFPIQLCPLYFNNYSRIIKIMINVGDKEYSHSRRGAFFRSNKPPPLVFLCISATCTFCFRVSEDAYFLPLQEP